MPLFERTLSRLKRRWLVGEILRMAAGWIAGFLMLFGTVMLAVKLFAPRFWPDVLWLGLLVIPIAVVVLWRAVHRLPDDSQLIAHLDRRLGAGGLLMTLSERSDDVWQHNLPTFADSKNALPRVRPRRFAKAIAIPAIFAVGTGFIPPRSEPPPAPRITSGSEAARELAETFELLEKADALDEDTRATLRREVEQLAEETHDRPLTHEKWETVDALRERMQSGLEATQLSISQGQSAVAAFTAAANDGQPLSLERTAQLNDEIREALETMRKNGVFDATKGDPAKGLPAELQELVKSGEFRLPDDSVQRRQALDGLQKLLDTESQRLATARGMAASNLRDDAQGSLVARNAIASDQTGQGGLSRGRSDAELDYGLESDEQAAKFKAAVLPPGFLDQPNESVQGVSASAPQVDPADEARGNSPRTETAATGKTTWDRRLKPRHREIVRQYFGD